MKKVITILAILVVLVGAVFADDPTNSDTAKTADGKAVLTLKAAIPEAVPQFRLAIASSEDAVGSANADVRVGAATGDYDDDATTPDTAKPDGTGETSFDAEKGVALLTSSTGTGVEVDFVINQITKANVTAVYYITVAATDLVLKSYSDGTDGPASPSANQKFTLSTTTGKGASPAITAGANASGTTGLSAAVDTSDSNKLVVTYNGAAQVDATASAAKELGKFTVGWTNNANAVAGNYEATVTMQVASR